MAGGGISAIVLPLQLLIACILLHLAQAEFCSGYKHTCDYPNKCCANRCCIPSEEYEHAYRAYRWNVWNMWYFWFIVIFFMVSCFGGCGYWRRRQIMISHHSRGHPALRAYTTTTTTTTTYHCGRPSRVVPSLGIPLYPRVGLNYPPQISNCSTETQDVFPAPPPYAEVMTKPHVYPPRYDSDSLPPYPGDPVYTSSVPLPGALMNQRMTGSESANATSEGLPPYSPQMLTNQDSAASAANRSGPYRPGANPSQAQWRPPTSHAAAAAVAFPDEMDSNGNEINSNIYPDNANLQAANQPGGNSNPANRRPDSNHDSDQSSCA